MLVEPRHRGERRRRRAVAVEPRGHAVVGELGAVAHDGAIDVRCADRAVALRRVISDDDRQSVLVAR